MPTVRYTVIEGEVLSELRGGVKRDYVPDPLGSTIALLDNSQTRTDTFEYWPYGESAARTGTTATPFQHVGTIGYYQDSSERSYVRARYLDKGKGRWNTEDPIGFNGGSWNVFCYVNNNCITIFDPSGYYPKVICPSNPGHQKDLENAVSKVCSALTGAGEEGLKKSRCLNRLGQEKCVIDWCNHSKSTVSCGNTKECNRIEPGMVKCAYSRTGSGPGKGVYICPGAWNTPGCKKWPCSSLGGNILHEIASLCGTPHDKGGPVYPDSCDFRANCLCNNIYGLI